MSNINLGSGTYTPVAESAKVLDLDADSLAALGNKSPEKWEGLAIGPRLASGDYLLLAGTDNDYSVTQNGSGEQFGPQRRLGRQRPRHRRRLRYYLRLRLTNRYLTAFYRVFLRDYRFNRPLLRHLSRQKSRSLRSYRRLAL